MKRNLLLFCSVVIVLAGLVYTGHRSTAAKVYLESRFLGRSETAPNEIVVWHPWGGVTKEGLELLLKDFEKAHPGAKVKPVFVSNGIGSCQKFFTAIAAGKAPDVMFVDGTQVAEWAAQGALEPLEDRVKESGIKPEDYFIPCWKQCVYQEHIWAVTYCADPNFAFAWNKNSFREAGLDPDKPPRSIEEMDQMAEKLTKYGKNGLEVMGAIPYGGANVIYTWGWAFGGDFYDEKRKKITANDPKVVEALEWMCSCARKYDIKKIQAFQQGFGSMDQNPFYVGKMAMHPFYHICQVQDARMYAPNLDYGLTYIPTPEGGEPHSSWVGGWCMSLPKGCKHPELGWELIRWICADDKGTQAMGNRMGLLPGYRKSPFLQQLEKDPRYRQYVQIMRECKHQRPVIPVQAYYMGALDRATEYALYGRMTAKEALDKATQDTQRELDLKLKGE